MKRFLTILKSLVTNNIGYKIIAIIFAFILWLVVVNIQNPASRRTFSNIPVTIANEESVLDGDHIYTITSGKTATITVAATRSVLGNLSASDFVAVADFSALSITNAAPITVSLVPEKSRYENQIDITQRTTSMVIDIENVVTKELPVEVIYTGTQPEGMSIDKVNLSPEKVGVTVPESKSNQVSRVAVTIDYSDINNADSMELTPAIYDVDGKEVPQTEDTYLNTNAVQAQFITYDTKEIPVSIEPFGEPAVGYEVSQIAYSREKVNVKGEKGVLSKLNEIELPGSLVDISNRTDDLMTTIDLKDYVPEGVTFVDSEGDRYLIVINVSIIKTENEDTGQESTEAEQNTLNPDA